MTRKDYKLLTSVIRRIYDGYPSYDNALRLLATVLADELKVDNPERFDRERFLKTAIG